MSPSSSFVFCLITFLYFITGNNLLSHGLEESTLVKVWNGSKSIKSIADNVLKNKKVVSFKFRKNRCTSGHVKAAGKSIANCYMRIGFDNVSPHKNDLLCTPTQEFYLPIEQKWIPAYLLKIGDVLKSDLVGLITVTHVELINHPLSVYILEISSKHNLFVGKYFVLTHNMTLPWTCSFCISIPFGGGAALGGQAGSFLGPMGIAGGLILGGVVGWMVEDYKNKSTIHQYQSFFDSEIIDSHRKNKSVSQKEEETTIEETEEAIKIILQETKPGRKTKGKSKQVEKPGNYDDAEKDFEKLGATKIKNIPSGKTGILPDGKSVNVRAQSSFDKPTLEIHDKVTNKRIKIRYIG